MINVHTRLGGVQVLSLMLSVVGLLGQVPAAAQCGRQWLPGAPDPGTTAGGVYTIVSLPNGDVIIGGRFVNVGAVRATGVARYNTATGRWTSLGSGTTGTVSGLTLCPNGDVIAIGDFTEAGGLFTRGVARFSFVTGAWSVFGQDLIAGDSLGRIDKVIALPDGDLLVGGTFSRGGGIELDDIARYRPSTGQWLPIGAPMGTSVRWLQNLPEGPGGTGGGALALANFTDSQGLPGRRLMRFDPNTGAWSPLGANLPHELLTLDVLPSGEIVAALDFFELGGSHGTALTRYNPATDTWSPLVRLEYVVLKFLSVLPDGDAVFSGDTQLPVPASGRLDLATGQIRPSDQRDEAFSDFRTSVRLPSGELLIGGEFWALANGRASGIVAFNPQNDTWRPLSPHDQAGTRVTALGSDGLGGVLGGVFSAATAGDRVDGLVRYDAEASRWINVGANPNRPGPFAGEILAITPLPGGPTPDILVGGSYASIAGVSTGCIARYSVATDTWSTLGAGVDKTNGGASISAITVLPDGDVVAAGDFQIAGGVAANNIARYSMATGSWSPLGAGVSPSFSASDLVSAMIVLPNGELLVAGGFKRAGGVAVNNLARYNFVTNSWSGTNNNDGLWWGITALVLLPDSDVAVGGHFYRGGEPWFERRNLARYNPTTNAWSTLTRWRFNNVEDMLMLPDGELLIAANTLSVWPSASGSINRLNLTTDTHSPLGVGPSDVPAHLAVLPNGDLLAAGNFAMAGNRIAPEFARFTMATLPPEIITQPNSATACPGFGAVMTVTAAGAEPMSFQWRKDGVPIEQPPLVTDLTLYEITAEQAGVYDCVVSNPCGSTTSAPAVFVIGSCACSLADIAGGNTPYSSPDGQVDAIDFVTYINWFSAADEYGGPADIAGAGDDGLQRDGVVDGADFIAFMNAFAAGC